MQRTLELLFEPELEEGAMEQNGGHPVAEIGEGFERVEEVGLDCEVV